MASRRNQPKSKFSRPPDVHHRDNLEERKLFLLIVEGDTEEKYFQHFRISTGRNITNITNCGKKSSKSKLVNIAIKQRVKYREQGHYDDDTDETWVVFDRDKDIQNQKDRDSFNQALELAKNNHIEVAYSNDSFELWFLLHFKDVSSEMDRNEIDAKLRKHLPRYQHGNDVFDNINLYYPKAVERSKKLLEDATNNGLLPADANPSTKVHLLTEKLIAQQRS